jgi:bacillithiol system protein YtxJ
VINWQNLSDFSQIDLIQEESQLSPVVLFKHSTTCPISAMAKLRLESKWNLSLKAYYLDLLSNRPISNEIAERFSVKHESPQLLLISEGECIYDASHMDINVDELNEVLETTIKK